MPNKPTSDKRVPRAARPLDIEHDELMDRAAAEHQARTASETARKDADRAAVLSEAADDLAEFIALHGPTSRTVAGWRGAIGFLRRLAAEAQQHDTETQAHPPQHSWRVETRDPVADQWAPGSHFAHRPNALERLDTANRTAPLWNDGTPVERRIVRETTTYTVEEQPPTAPSPESGRV